jgi:hypothetical protein
MRLNRQYRAEASVLEMSRTERPDFTRHARHRLFVFVDSVDLAEVEALRYAKGLHADDLTAVHFVLDAAQAARLQQRWDHFDQDTALRMVDCSPNIQVPRSPCCCRAERIRHCWAGCCTTAPRTRRPA